MAALSSLTQEVTTKNYVDCENYRMKDEELLMIFEALPKFQANEKNIAIIAKALQITSGFKELADGGYEMTLPEGIVLPAEINIIDELGNTLNKASTLSSFGENIFHSFLPWLWSNHEVHTEHKTEPGKTYQFDMIRTPMDQIEQYEEGTPLGAVIMAEASKKFLTNCAGSICIGEAGEEVSRILGADPRRLLHSYPGHRVELCPWRTSADSSIVEFAKLRTHASTIKDTQKKGRLNS